MPTGPRLLLEHACYHITTRGNQKQRVFLDEEDYQVYLFKLRKYKTRHGFMLYGFCLMPNHVHLIGEPKAKENLARFMHGLNRSYTAYFNKKYNKVGYLWQGRFRSKAIVKDNYLIDCIQYIELNPVRADLSKAPGSYQWSSHKERTLSNSAVNNLLNHLHL